MKTKTANKGASGTRPDVHQRVTDHILELLERGTVPWRKPWNVETGPPANFISGKPYQGVNILLLGWEERPSPWWMTYRQARERGGNVRKGERGTSIVKYGRAKPKDDGRSAEESLSNLKVRMFLKEFTVFNASQIEGINFPSTARMNALSEELRIARAETVVREMASPPTIREGTSSKACYCPALDRVKMPGFGCFHSPQNYYSTLFHELVHSTGHPSRLARATLMGFENFADHEYSKEELVAEMGSALLSSELGISSDGLEASASYLQSWLRVLKVKEHRRWIIEAAGKAGKAVNLILGRNGEESSSVC